MLPYLTSISKLDGVMVVFCPTDFTADETRRKPQVFGYQIRGRGISASERVNQLLVVTGVGA